MVIIIFHCFSSGNPDASDLTGNTALHLATIHGHIDCVSFLINFGSNLWSLNNDYQTAKDVTVRAHCDSRKAQELLILLDESMARALMMNPKLVAKQQEKALIEAEKRMKQFEKIHKKSLKKAEKEEKQMEKIRSKLIVAPIETHAKIISSATNYTNINQSSTNYIGTNHTDRLMTDPNQSVTNLTGTNTKKTGRLFQTNTSRNLIKSLSNINPLESSSSQSLSGQTTTCCHGSTNCKDCSNNRSEEDEDGLEVVECQKPSNLNVRGIMSEVLKNNRSKEGSNQSRSKEGSNQSRSKEGPNQSRSNEGSRFSVGDYDNQIFRSGENLDRLSQTGSNLIRSKSGSTIQLFESKLAPRVTPKTFSQIVNGDRDNYSNGVNYTNYKPRNDQSSGSSSISSSWKGTISKLNKLAINTSLGAVSKRILHRKASTGSTNSGTSHQSNQSNEGVVLKQLLIKSGSLNNLSTIYCTSSDSSSNRIKTNGKEKNGFTLMNGTNSSKSSFSSGNNNDINSLTNSSSDEFKMIEKINQDSGIGSSVKVRPLSGLRSSLDPEQVLYVRKNPMMESIDEQLINSGLINGLTNPGLIHSSLYMSHKMNNSGVNSMYHSMNSLSMKSQPWIEMFQKKTQL